MRFPRHIDISAICLTIGFMSLAAAAAMLNRGYSVSAIAYVGIGGTFVAAVASFLTINMPPIPLRRSEPASSKVSDDSHTQESEGDDTELFDLAA